MSLIEKLRAPKFAGMAVFDWVATIAAALAFAWFTRGVGSSVPFWRYFLVVFVTFVLLGILVHKLLGINTQFGRYIGLTPPPRTP